MCFSGNNCRRELKYEMFEGDNGIWENKKWAHDMMLATHHRVLPNSSFLTWLPSPVLAGARGQRNRNSPCPRSCHNAVSVPNE